MTLNEFKNEMAGNLDYKNLAVTEWDKKIRRRGLHQRSQKDFDWFESMYVQKITDLRAELTGEWDFSCKVSDDGKTLKSDAEILAAVKQKMDYWYLTNESEQRACDKLICVLKERELRKDNLVVRTGIHDATNYYIDHDNASGTITGTWTFTNGSDTVTANSDGNAQAELAVGDWIQPGDNTAEWYAIESITDDDTLVLLCDWKQANITDTTDATRFSDISVNDGTTTAKAFVHITAYITDTALAPGDVGYVRANKTYVYASQNMNFDDDSDVSDYQYLIGCDSVTNDPWSDGSDVKPIIDFDGSTYKVTGHSWKYLWIERLDFRDSASGSGMFLSYNTAIGTYVKSCNFQKSSSIGDEAFICNGEWIIDSCTFSDCKGATIYVGKTSRVTIKNCTIDAGSVVGSTYGIQSSYASQVYVIDSTIAGSNAFSTAAVKTAQGGVVHLRNVTFGTESYVLFGSYDAGGFIYSEDHDGVFEAHLGKRKAGDAERDTGTVHSGGANSSVKLTPANGRCGALRAITIKGDSWTPEPDFAIWAEADTEIKVSVWACVDSAWDSALTAEECYIKTSHLSNAGSAARTETQSNEQISNTAKTWTELSTTITPARDGFVYVTFFLAKYDADESVYVDIKPTAVAT